MGGNNRNSKGWADAEEVDGIFELFQNIFVLENKEKIRVVI